MFCTDLQLVSVWRSKGWVHGDIKPDNIGIDAAMGSWYFLDVESVCRHGGPGSRINTLDRPVHTPRYAAPELLSLQPFVADTTDLYSVGVILRECCDVCTCACLIMASCCWVMCLLSCTVRCYRRG